MPQIYSLLMFGISGFVLLSITLHKFHYGLCNYHSTLPVQELYKDSQIYPLFLTISHLQLPCLYENRYH